MSKDYSALTNEELRNENITLARIQTEEVDAGNRESALLIAEERQALFEEAEERGFVL